MHIMATVIKVPKNATKEQLDEIRKRIEMLPRKNIAKHFGALKRGIDGLEYQKKMRNEWD